MMRNIRSFVSLAVFVATVSCLAVHNTSLAAAGNQTSAADMEQQLIGVLKSDAAPPDKAITCKRLAIYGTKNAVPALAPLLLDQELSSWARIALEAIPDPAADAALRDALNKTSGRLLVGVINSLGVRGDKAAVGALAARLRDNDTEVAAAAAEALGNIGGDQATRALEQALTTGATDVRSAVAFGCILCAEKLLTGGKAGDAARLYDTVRQAKVPKQRVLEATRGAILARGSAGMPLLLEQLRSADRALVGIGLRTARELPGREVTEALVAEFKRTDSDRQALLLLALGDRDDPAVLPTVVEAATKGAKSLRVVALEILGRRCDLSCVPVLLNAAAEGDPELTQIAKPALARLEGREVDQALLARLPQSTGKLRQILIELAAQRRIDGALPLIVQSADDADAGVRRSAVEMIGAIGEAPQSADLVRLLQSVQNPGQREDLERALLTICRRSRTECLPHVSPLVRNNDAALRTIGLHGLGAIGGPEALAMVTAAVNDTDQTIQDEAVSTLSTWPSSWPEDAGVAEPLLTLAKSGQKTSHRVKAARGYLQFVQENKKLTHDEKLARINELLPLVQRPEEKRLVIATLGAIPTAGSLEMLMTLADEPAIAEEACLPIVKIATGTSLKDGSRELRRKALQTVVDKSKNDATRKQAEAGLKKVQ